MPRTGRCGAELNHRELATLLVEHINRCRPLAIDAIKEQNFAARFRAHHVGEVVSLLGRARQRGVQRRSGRVWREESDFGQTSNGRKRSGEE